MEDKFSRDKIMSCCNNTGGRMVMVAVIITLTFLIGYGFGSLTEQFNRDSRTVCPLLKFNKQAKNTPAQQPAGTNVKNTIKSSVIDPEAASTK